jgi:hypothetical protein
MVSPSCRIIPVVVVVRKLNRDAGKGRKEKKSVNERKPFGRKVEEQPKKRKAERTVGWNAKGKK